MNTYFVVRDTDHPAEDLKRNWSGFAGGSCNGEDGGATKEEAKEKFASFLDIDVDEVENEFKFHPAYNQCVAQDYEGLGAFQLDSDNIEEAIKEAFDYENGTDLAVCTESGDGHFYAEDCVNYYKVREVRYVFEIKL